MDLCSGALMLNRLYKYLVENNILYSKQFDFQNRHPTDHAVVQLVDQIIESFKNTKDTYGLFTDLSKAFDTVDHFILLKKLNYLNGRKKFENKRVPN